MMISTINLEQQFYEAALFNELSELKELLIEDHRLLNLPSYWGETALMAACKNGHLKIISELLSHADIEINAADQEGNTALHYAVKAQQAGAVKLLLSKKANCLKLNNRNANPLSEALYHYRDNPKKSLKIVNLLLEKASAAHINQEVAGGHILVVACQLNLTAVVRCLLAHKKLCLQGRGSWALPTIIKTTPNKKNKDIIALLLEEPHLDLTAIDLRGQTALQAALSYSRFDIAEKILRHDSLHFNQSWQENDATLFMLWLDLLDYPCFLERALSLFSQEFLDNAINKPLFNDLTLLMMAAENGQLGSLMLLMSESAININTQNNSGQTAFMLACLAEQEECAAALLSQPYFEVSLEDAQGLSQLHYAANSNMPAVSERLIEKIKSQRRMKTPEKKTAPTFDETTPLDSDIFGLDAQKSPMISFKRKVIDENTPNKARKKLDFK